MAAALALGLQPGDVAISLGTSGTVYAVSETPTADPTGAVAGFADATGRFLPLVCTLNATKVTDTVAPLARCRPRRRSTRSRSRRPPAPTGVVVVPYFDGERTPNRPDALGHDRRGAHLDDTGEHLARAAVEGVVCGLLDGLDALTAAGVRADGQHPPRRRVARVRRRTSGCSPTSRAGRSSCPDASEHVAAGACVQAAAVLHGTTSAPSPVRGSLNRGLVVEPKVEVDGAAVRAAYAEACEGTVGS